MKYSCSVEIERPIDRVAQLWQDPEFFDQWQDGFESIHLIEGNEGEQGAVSDIIIKQGPTTIELRETIRVNDLPNEKTALYVHKHMTNTQTTRFVELESNRTKYISEVEYTQFNGIMIKLMAKLFPGKFKAQSQKWMNQFKEFAEQQLS